MAGKCARVIALYAAWHERETQRQPVERQRQPGEDQHVDQDAHAQTQMRPQQRHHGAREQGDSRCPDHREQQIAIAERDNHECEAGLNARLRSKSCLMDAGFFVIGQTHHRHHQLPDAPPPPNDPPPPENPPPENPPPPPNPPPPKPPPLQPQLPLRWPPRNRSGQRNRPNTIQITKITIIMGKPPVLWSSSCGALCASGVATTSPPNTRTIALTPSRTPPS